MEGPSAQQDMYETIFNEDEQLVHWFHQTRQPAGSRPMDVKVLPFNGPLTLGGDNLIEIPAIPLHVEDMWLQVTTSAATEPDTSTFVDSPYMVRDSPGVQLNYQRIAKISVSGPELIYSSIFDVCPEQQLGLFRQVFNNEDIANADTAQVFYIPLKRVADFMKFVGPLNAYRAKDWSLNIPLKGAGSIVRGGSTADWNGTMTGNLILIGNRTTSDDTMRTVSALRSGGVRINYLQGIYKRTELADNNGSLTSYQITVDNISGACSAMRLGLRAKTGASSADPQTVEPEDWINIVAPLVKPADRLSLGYSYDPTQVGGSALPFKLWNYLFPRDSNKNSSVQHLPIKRAVDEGGSATYNITNMLDTGILSINFGEAESDLSGGFATSTGSLVLNKDFQLNLDIETDILDDNYAELVLYLHRVAVITADSFNSLPSE